MKHYANLNFNLSASFRQICKRGTYILLSIILAMLISCSSSTSTDPGSLSAYVILHGEDGAPIDDSNEYTSLFAGLFQATDSDTTLVRILLEHPNIGASHYSESAFDHREHSPLRIVQAGSDGKIVINTIAPGNYILVILKAGFGLEYVDVSIGHGDDQYLGTIEMHPVVVVSGTYENDLEFETGMQYYVVADANFLSSVVFESGASIFVEPAASLRFYGTIDNRDSITESHWCITSSHGVWEFNAPPSGVAEYAGSNVFYTETLELHNGKLTYTNNPVVVFSNNSVIDNMYIDKFGTGITIQNSSASLSNSILNNGLSSGISVIGDNHKFELSYTIVANQIDGINMHVFGGYNINNCYFVDNYYAIRPDRCSGDIANNCFDRNYFDIYQFQVNTPVSIVYNNFYYSRSRSLFPRRVAIINNNNFFATDGYFIWIRDVGAPPYSFVDNDIDARNNYWMPADVDLYIQDANDNHEYPGENCPHYVLYQPRRASRILSAGITSLRSLE